MKQGGIIPPPKTSAWGLYPSCKTMGSIKPNAKKSQSSFRTITSIFSKLFVFACMHNHCGSKSKWGWVTVIPLLPKPHCPLLGEWWSLHPSPTCRGVWTSWLLPERVQIFLLSESKCSLFSLFLRARLWQRMETGCPAFQDDPVPGQPEGNANYQSLCGIIFKWECLVPMNFPMT